MKHVLASGVSSVLVDTQIFSDRVYTFSEALVVYLHREGFSNSEIGRLLGRDGRTVWTLLNRAGKKKASGQKKTLEGTFVPTFVFRNRTLSIMESLIVYLREKYSYREIGNLLNRNERTVWTVCKRGMDKLKNS